MIKLITKYYKKYQEIIIYIIVGGLTTVVSIGSYALCRLFMYYQLANILSWVCAVAFAYYANRKFVFRSQNKNIIKELYKFVTLRLLSLVSEIGVMYLLVSILDFNDLISKVVVQFIVLALNYIFSKIFVFKK
ncbi:MAG TPA: GtrA family protein [Bacilli bacterium]|nr:GtrA family protein [Bacilli bacterium]